MKVLLKDTAARAIAYLDGLDARSVAPTPEAIARLAEFDEPLPNGPTSPDLVLRRLDELGSPATVAMAGPRYFGFVIGGSLPAALAANWLAGAWDQNAAYYNVSPVAAQIEQVALHWVVDLLRLPVGCAGAFVTGATMANLSALAAARHAVLQQVGWNVETDGLFGAPPITIVVGAEVHPSVIKSLGILGLRTHVITVPVDDQGRMRADAIPPLTGPTILCAQAGNVNTGACDPFPKICERAHTADGWVHYPPTVTPYRDPADTTPELSRRARGIEVWAALRSLGGHDIDDMIERTCRYARRFAEGLRAASYDILNDVVLNQVLVLFRDAETTQRVTTELQADGTCWCGTTVWHG